VCFASFQDFLGKNKAGGIKLKNEWAHAINWDCIILDEYHYGAWRDMPRNSMMQRMYTNRSLLRARDWTITMRM
jgi:hypothetical protein